MIGALVVLVAAAVITFVLYDRLVAGGSGVDLSVDEVEESVLTEAEVAEASSAGEALPYTSITLESVLEAQAVDFGGARVAADLDECSEVARRILPGRQDAGASAAFRHIAKNTVVLHTVEPASGDAMSVSELTDWVGTCASPLAEASGGRTQIVTGMGVEVEDLGDAAFWTSVDLQFTSSTADTQVANGYLHVVVVERDGVTSTLSVITGDDPASSSSYNRDLALRLARFADAKLGEIIARH